MKFLRALESREHHLSYLTRLTPEAEFPESDIWKEIKQMLADEKALFRLFGTIVNAAITERRTTFMASLRSLADLSTLDHKTIRRLLPAAEESGFLRVLHKPSNAGGERRPGLYQIIDPDVRTEIARLIGDDDALAAEDAETIRVYVARWSLNSPERADAAPIAPQPIPELSAPKPIPAPPEPKKCHIHAQPQCELCMRFRRCFDHGKPEESCWECKRPPKKSGVNCEVPSSVPHFEKSLNHALKSRVGRKNSENFSPVGGVEG